MNSSAKLLLSETSALMYSVAVPCFNEADRIGRLLAFLSAETRWQPAEIIVCDSLSSDDTAAVVRRWQRRMPTLRLIEADHPGKAAAWNCLMHAARSPLVVFIDADVSPAPECLTKLVSAARRSDHLIYGCRRRARPSADTLASYFLRLLADPVIELCLVGGCYAVRREPVLARLRRNGFREMPDVFAEDTWLQALFLSDELCILHDCVIDVDLFSFDAYLRVQARKRLIFHELEQVFPLQGRQLRTSFPEALDRLAQARLVMTWPVPLADRLRWFVGAAVKSAINLCFAAQISGKFAEYRQAYDVHGGGWVLRHLASTTPCSHPQRVSMSREIVPMDAEAKQSVPPSILREAANNE